MLFLTQVSETFTLTTAAALSTDWSVGYVDMSATGATAGSAQGNIATATTTTIVASPVIGVQRQLKSMTVVNLDASSTQTVTLTKNDGSGRALIRNIPLLPNESLDWVDTIGFRVLSSTGTEKGGTASAGGTNKQVQYNDSGALGGTAGFEYDKASNILTVQKFTASGLVTTVASATASAGFNVPHGAAPTAPVNGDFWSTTSGFFGRVNGSTVGPFGTGGGGGLTNWTEALKITTPYSTTSAAASFVATNATATSIAAVLSPKGTGPIQAQVADTTATGGNIRGASSVDWQTVRASASQVAGGVQAVLAGGINNQVGGTNCVVGGGTTNVASANNSTIAGGSTNTASNDSATVGGGATNTASQVFTTIAGGNTNTASVRGASIGGGESNQASGNNSVIPGGKANFADATYAFSMGNAARTRGLYAVDAWCPGNTAYASKVQSLRMRLLEQTTSATPKVLTADQSGAPSNTNQYGLNPSMLCVVRGRVSGRTAAGVTSAWEFVAAIKQQTNNAGTALVGTPTVTLVGQDAGASTWGTPTITADTTNGAMAITVTGAAATTINWVATIDSTENTF